jgi:TctA family transporter
MSDATPSTDRPRSTHDSYELPDELDFGKLRIVGFGLESLKSHHESKAGRVQVELEADVAAVFRTSEEVNEALRTILRAAERLSGRASA